MSNSFHRSVTDRLTTSNHHNLLILINKYHINHKNGCERAGANNKNQ